VELGRAAAPGSGSSRSTDGGDTWKEITRAQGLPQAGLIGKIGWPCRRRTRARLGDHRGRLGRRLPLRRRRRDVDEDVNDERKLRQRAWYYSRIFADPKDTNVVYALNVGFYRSTDGGKTFRTIPRRTATTTTCGSRRTTRSG
jgi:hypothetical protein